MKHQVWKNKSNVFRIQDPSDIWVEDPDLVHSLCIQEYTHRFTSTRSLSIPRQFYLDDIFPCISDYKNESLIAPLIPQEVYNVVIHMDSSKTPESDSFGPIFFQSYWYIIGPFVTQTILEFFNTGNLLREFNRTFITLILKVDNPSSPGHYRLISLCGTFYKIISKILVNRLWPILDAIISPL